MLLVVSSTSWNGHIAKRGVTVLRTYRDTDSGEGQLQVSLHSSTVAEINYYGKMNICILFFKNSGSSQ